MKDDIIEKLKNKLKMIPICNLSGLLKRYIIFKQRPKLVIWLIANLFMMFSSMITMNLSMSFVFSILICFVIINFSLSETAERIMRAFSDMRHIATSTEKERLIPIFKEVYERAGFNSKYISSDIKLYIIDEISVNAYSLGKNTIAVTRGLMETMSDDEIKGVLAHEFAHNVYGDSQLKILITLGTSIYLWIMLILKIILRSIEGALKDGLIQNIFSIARFIVELAIETLIVIWTVILSGSSRKKEYRADEFTYKIGYGEELTSALYKLYSMQISDKRKLIERVQIGHPRIAYRIEKLELLSKYDEYEDIIS